MTALGPSTLTAVSVTPSALFALRGEPGPDGPHIVGGEVRELEPGIFPPPISALAPFMGRRVECHLAVPIFVRSAFVELPSLAPSELARGALWEARRVFRDATEECAYDFELLEAAPATTTAARRALLIALRQRHLGDWLTWLRQLKRPPQRLEPIFAAWTRSLRWMAAHSPEVTTPRVYMLGDSSGCAVAVVSPEGVLGARCVPPRRGAPLENRLRGEEGIRLLRESLLAFEDRYPWTTLDALVPMGSLDADWCEHAARAVELPLTPPPRAPDGVPEDVASHGRWCVPFGTLLGA